jgi:hypothetical protein
VDESIYKNPRDPVEERFERLEAQVVEICRDMNLHMVTLASKLEPFGDDAGSNSENGSKGKSEDRE